MFLFLLDFIFWVFVFCVRGVKGRVVGWGVWRGRVSPGGVGIELRVLGT